MMTNNFEKRIKIVVIRGVAIRMHYYNGDIKIVGPDLCGLLTIPCQAIKERLSKNYAVPLKIAINLVYQSYTIDEATEIASNLEEGASELLKLVNKY